MKFKGKIWKTGNSFVITIPQQYIEDGVYAHGETYYVDLSAANDKSAVRVECESCGGYAENPTPDHVNLVTEGMTCGCGGSLKVIYDDA